MKDHQIGEIGVSSHGVGNFVVNVRIDPVLPNEIHHPLLEGDNNRRIADQQAGRKGGGGIKNFSGKDRALYRFPLLIAPEEVGHEKNDPDPPADDLDVDGDRPQEGGNGVIVQTPRLEKPDDEIEREKKRKRSGGHRSPRDGRSRHEGY
ncbi:MAG: hypothetical protein MPW14_22350 [Candidatus Manganitrophus sp.]|nr:MAG: hypothetical protein MPW14_22350 [Candidatus Manganitrophus sp.]